MISKKTYARIQRKYMQILTLARNCKHIASYTYSFQNKAHSRNPHARNQPIPPKKIKANFVELIKIVTSFNLCWYIEEERNCVAFVGPYTAADHKMIFRLGLPEQLLLDHSDAAVPWRKQSNLFPNSRLSFNWCLAVWYLASHHHLYMPEPSVLQI